MLFTGVVLRGTLGVKSALNQATVFNNLLQKSIFRRYTGFRAWNGNSQIFSSGRRRISISRLNKAENLARNCDNATAVLNNVIIYKYERGTAFAFIMVFSVIQLFGMLSMASNLYTTFCADIFNREKSWSTRLLECKYSVFGIASGCFFGPMIFITVMATATRTIRRIILHKGGDKVTIVTYHPVPRKAAQTVPLKNVSCKASRHVRGTLPVSISGKKFYYFIDSDGDFPNSDLFDFTS
ncbi:transmembrane protein 223 isoform X2 [Belonocnema kinseyi]|uniref:transmembrane protein 223 isoform X2 n=1 Tax=Belonocnema kinseyi TaxID=2817044 RepID=UPI00143CD233|nr:transmembrane protein 223 isoform X2 [Belonocnema kinseyi]